MGSFLRELGQLEEADRFGADAVQGARAKLATSHPMLGRFLLQCGRTLAAMERFDEGEVALLEAHTIFITALGGRHRRTIDAVDCIAEFYDAWDVVASESGRDEQAARWRGEWPHEAQPEENLETVEASTQPVP